MPQVSAGDRVIPYVRDADFTLYVGDALDVLRQLPDGSVDCCVTSPPYWGLRDYGTGEWDGGDDDCDHQGAIRMSDKTTIGRSNGKDRQLLPDAASRHVYKPFRYECGKCGARRIDLQLGLEPTPAEYVERIVEVFRDVRRVLAAHGTCWLNLGDSYAGSVLTRGFQLNDGLDSHASLAPPPSRTVPCGLKPKDLVGIPWRVAFALQTDGWYLRSDIIWSKPNPMPESVTDRPTKAHEYVFLLSKSPRYWFDAEAVREPLGDPFRESDRYENTRDHQPFSTAGNNIIPGGYKRPGPPILKVPQLETLDGSEGEAPRGADGRRATRVVAGNGSLQHRDGERWPNAGRNIRSVWEIATQPFPEAHFATFPEALVERCVKAGAPEYIGVCPVCRLRYVYDSGVRELRGELRSEVGEPSAPPEVLRAELRESFQRSVTSGPDEDEQGLRRPTSPGPSSSEQAGLCDGAPDRGRGNYRTITAGGRGSPSPKRREGRQSPGESRGDGEADSRSQGQETGAPASVSALSEDDRDSRRDEAHCPACDVALARQPGVVLDPFSGSGTTALVARRLGRRSIGIELNAEYAAMCAKRLQQLSLLADGVA